MNNNESNYLKKYYQMKAKYHQIIINTFINNNFEKSKSYQTIISNISSKNNSTINNLLKDKKIFLLKKSLYSFSKTSFSKKVKKEIKEIKRKEFMNLNDFKPLFKANKQAVNFIHKTRFLSFVCLVLFSYNLYRFTNAENNIVKEHKNEPNYSDQTSDIFSVNKGMIENEKKKQRYIILALLYVLAMGYYLSSAYVFHNMSKNLVIECDYNNQDNYLKFVKYNLFYGKVETLENQSELTRNYSTFFPHYTVVNRNNWRRYLISEDYFKYSENKRHTIEDIVTDKESEIRAKGKQIIVRKVNNENSFFKKKSSNRKTLILFTVVSSSYCALEYYLNN